MAVSAAYRSFVLDSLARVVPGLRSRSMFGGVGIYAGDLFFALISSRETFYLKVDDANRGDFEARGLGPFRPFGEGGEVMQYYELPNDVLEDPDELRGWVQGAIAAARRKQQRPRRAKEPEEPPPHPGPSGPGGVEGASDAIR